LASSHAGATCLYRNRVIVSYAYSSNQKVPNICCNAALILTKEGMRTSLLNTS
jgi:hypothetical protein